MLPVAAPAAVRTPTRGKSKSTKPTPLFERRLGRLPIGQRSLCGMWVASPPDRRARRIGHLFLDRRWVPAPASVADRARAGRASGSNNDYHALAGGKEPWTMAVVILLT